MLGERRRYTNSDIGDSDIAPFHFGDRDSFQKVLGTFQYAAFVTVPPMILGLERGMTVSGVLGRTPSAPRKNPVRPIS